MDHASSWNLLLLSSLLTAALLVLLPAAICLVAGLCFAFRNRSKVSDISSQLAADQFSDKTVVLTGASSGIGAECAFEFARRGATVYMLVRSLERGEQAAKQVRERTQNGRLVIRQLDMSSLAEVSRFCDQFCSDESPTLIDALVNNAGVFSPPFGRTPEGFDQSLACNHLGHYLLTCLLLARGRLAPNARLVLVTGAMYKDGCQDVTQWNKPIDEADYSGLQAYRNSKLAICLFGLALHRQFQAADSRAKVFLVHPGVVGTNISRHLLLGLPRPIRACLLSMAGSLMLTSSEGCQGILACTADLGSSLPSGAYFHNCRREAWHRSVLKHDLAKAACCESARLVCECLQSEQVAEDLARCGLAGGQ